MPETQPSMPPPLPETREYPRSPGGGSSSSASFSVFLSSTLILVSVIYLAWTAMAPGQSAVSRDKAGPEAFDPREANELAILKLQSRLAIGLDTVNPVQGEQLISELEKIATAPRSQIAVAIVHAFVNEDRGRTKALDLLKKIQAGDGSEGGRNLAETVRKGIETGASEAEGKILSQELGWFARLVPPVDKGSDFGRDIKMESSRTMMILAIFTLLAFLVLLTGIVLLVVFLILRGNGSLPMRFQPAQGSSYHHLFLEVFAVYMGIMALGHCLGALIHEAISMAAYAVSFLLALAWPKLRGCPWKQARQMMGWSRGRGFFQEVAAGFAGYAGIVVIACCGLILTLIIVMIQQTVLQTGNAPGGADGAHPIVGMLDSAQSLKGQLLLLFFAAGVAPFLEETMFRGALFRFLRSRRGFIFSALAGGVIFAVIHPQGLIAVPALAGMGFGFALLREWRDSLIASMTAHSINNGVIVTLVLLALA